jgi:hypothetical protein
MREFMTTKVVKKKLETRSVFPRRAEGDHLRVLRLQRGKAGSAERVGSAVAE